MIRLGVNQDVFWKETEGFPAFEDMIRGVAGLGLNLFEFCPEYLEQTPDVLTPQRRREALALAESLGLKLIIHASFMCTNLCMIHDGMRAEALRHLKREIELAHDLESDVITVHPGPPWGHVRWYPEDYFWDIMARSYAQLVEFAEPLGVRVCTENMGRAFVGTEEGLARILSSVDAPHFGLTFDFGHHNLIYNDLPLSERTQKALEILRRFRDRIWVLHIHDNHGERDEHAAVGSGEIDYETCLPEVRRLGIQAYWSMELSDPDAPATSKAHLAKYL